MFAILAAILDFSKILFCAKLQQFLLKLVEKLRINYKCWGHPINVKRCAYYQTTGTESFILIAWKLQISGLKNLWGSIWRSKVNNLQTNELIHARPKLNSWSLEGERGSNWPPSIFLALNFCSLTDCQKLWHNCSLFVNTSFDTN